LCRPADLVGTRLAQIARLVALQRAGDPGFAEFSEALPLRTIQAMVRDCVQLGVSDPALIAATDGACWTGDPAERLSQDP
jgi:hypothetical protein